MEEITCTECISPNVDEDLLQRYSVVESFFDVKKDNKYYYCIGDAEDK
ncbi:MAG: hypothetical protein LBC61_04930 [Candidatus Peribacteria bacterium]|nr:hypothetical protein [Candidatus Peribacteria bacterium]